MSLTQPRKIIYNTSIISNLMISKTLNLWANGAVTLPKKWRERYKTKHFLARENKRGNLEISPIVDAQYWEDDKDNFGLRFPTGIEAGEFLKLWKAATKKIEQKEKRRHRTK